MWVSTYRHPLMLCRSGSDGRQWGLRRSCEFPSLRLVVIIWMRRVRHSQSIRVNFSDFFLIFSNFESRISKFIIIAIFWRFKTHLHPWVRLHLHLPHDWKTVVENHVHSSDCGSTEGSVAWGHCRRRGREGAAASVVVAAFECSSEWHDLLSPCASRCMAPVKQRSVT